MSLFFELHHFVYLVRVTILLEDLLGQTRGGALIRLYESIYNVVTVQLASPVNYLLAKLAELAAAVKNHAAKFEHGHLEVLAIVYIIVV